MEGELDQAGGDTSMSSVRKYSGSEETLVSSMIKISCTSLNWLVVFLF